jgi:hypothetical protein
MTVNSGTVKLGLYSSFIAFMAIAGYGAAQILQVAGLVTYPLDAILIYGFSLLIPIPFVLALLALHYSVPRDKKIWTHAALLFAAIYTAYVTLNYVVQLATVIPMTLRGALGEVRVLDQTPHSLFWDVDALGYIFMGIATFFAALAFTAQGLEKWVRCLFLANALVTPVIAFVYFYPTFSMSLLILGSPWLVTASGSMALLARFFMRKQAEAG